MCEYNILSGKNTVEVLCMTEKTGLEKTVVFNLKSANESDVNNIVNEKGHESRSFYYKLGLLYFLNIVDWICTEALIGSGHFVEANPVMQPVLENFWLTLLIKGILPLVLVLGCALIYKLAEIGRSIRNAFNGRNCVLCHCKPMAYFQFCIALLSILMYNKG